MTFQPIIRRVFRLGIVALLFSMIGETAQAQYVPPVYSGRAAYPFGFPWVDNSGGGYLMGAADVMRAQGQYLQDRQTAYSQREKARQEQLRTRRMLFDQRQYELANTPTENQRREATRQQQVLRAMTAPPQNEIISGQSLNALLQEYALMHAQGGRGPKVPVDPQTLSHVNVTSPGNAGTGIQGNPALLKQGKIEWPASLMSERFASRREAMDQAFMAALSEVRQTGRAGPAVSELDKQQREFRQFVSDSANAISLGDFLEAVQSLDDLKGAVDALRNPNLVRLMSEGQAKPEGDTVDTMVDSMTSRGLQFAPALPGEESDYMALHAAMAQYGLTMSASLSTPNRSPGSSP